MTTVRNLISFSLIILLCSCSGTSPDSKLLSEATEVHLASLEKASALERQIKGIKPEDEHTLHMLKQILMALQEWKENLAEVPGMEHEDHHHHGDEHDHSHQHHTHHHDPKLTAAEVLAIQKEFAAQLDSLERAFIQNTNQ